MGLGGLRGAGAHPGVGEVVITTNRMSSGGIRWHTWDKKLRIWARALAFLIKNKALRKYFRKIQTLGYISYRPTTHHIPVMLCDVLFSEVRSCRSRRST